MKLGKLWYDTFEMDAAGCYLVKMHAGDRFLFDIIGEDATETAESFVRAVNEREELLDALQDQISRCRTCHGGEAATIADERTIGQPLGSSRVPCPDCTEARAVLDRAKESETC